MNLVSVQRIKITEVTCTRHEIHSVVFGFRRNEREQCRGVRIWRGAEYCMIVKRQTQLEAWKRTRLLLTNRKKHSEQIMAGCLWIPTIDPSTSLVMPNVCQRCPKQSESATRRSRGTLTCACPGNGRSACIVVCEVTHYQLRDGSCDLS